MKDTLFAIILTLSIIIVSTYTTILLGTLGVRFSFTSASDYEYYCKQNHRNRMDYILPTWDIYCWLEEVQ